MKTKFDPSPMMVLGFEGDNAEDLRHRLKHFGGLGAILFKRNCTSSEQIQDLNQELGETWPGERPILAIDHEGPRVSRLRGIVDTPSGAKELGLEGDPEKSRATGTQMAEDLRRLGFNLNFAPVLDLEVFEDHPALKGRCFHEDPERVGRHGAAMIQGLHEGGVTACGKHFPGHGSAPLDSHIDMPTSPRDLYELRRQDLRPYKPAMEAGLELIMPAHVTFPEIDKNPAPCSQLFLQTILREELNYTGMVITDDCDMLGFQNLGPIRETVARCVKAGIDIFLCCRSPEVQEEVHAGLRDLYAQDYAIRETLEGTVKKALSLRRRILKRAEEKK